MQLSLVLGLILCVARALVPPICNAQSVYEHRCPYWEGKDSATTPISATDGVKVELTDANKNKGAACLDGTPPVFYIRDAQDASAKNKWHVFFEGGGACVGMTLITLTIIQDTFLHPQATRWLWTRRVSTAARTARAGIWVRASSTRRTPTSTAGT